MSVFNQFLGIVKPPLSIYNRYSTNNESCTTIQYDQVLAKRLPSGACTANVFKEIINITGSGILYIAAVATVDTTSRYIQIDVYIDGVQQHIQSTTITTAYVAQIMYGYLVPAPSAADNQIGPMPGVIFNKSLVIKIANSVSETDKIALYVSYCLT